MTLSFVTQHGTTSVEVAAPAPTSEPAYNPRFERFIAMMKERAGTVLEIGARVVGPGSALKASNLLWKTNLKTKVRRSSPQVRIKAITNSSASAASKAGFPPGCAFS